MRCTGGGSGSGLSRRPPTTMRSGVRAPRPDVRRRLAALLILLPVAAGAQQDSTRAPAPAAPPPAAPAGPARRNLPSLRPDTTRRQRLPGDTTSRDTTKGPRELVKW